MSATKLSALGSLVAVAGLSALVFNQGLSREVPLGRVNGVIVSKTSGKPVKEATVVIYPLDQPYQAQYEVNVPRRVTRTNEKGEFFARNLPAGKYEVSAYSANFADDSTKVEVQGQKLSNTKLELEANAPFVNLYIAQHVFLPNEKPTMHLNGWVKATNAHVSVWKLDTKALESGRRLEEIIQSVATNRTKTSQPTAGMSMVKEFNNPLTDRDDEGVFNQNLPLEGLGEGIYYAQLDLKDEQSHDKDKYYEDHRGTYIIVSKIGMVAKIDHNRVVAYVTDLDTGKPVAGATVGNASKSGTQKLGVTGADGTLEIPLSSFPKQVKHVEDDDGETSDKETDNRALGLVAEIGSSSAFIGSLANGSGSGTEMMAHIFTDRPVYRPGDTVQWKAILRNENQGHFTVPSGKNVAIVIKDPSDQVVLSKSFTTTDQGSVSGEFKTDPDQTGEYYVRVSSDGTTREQYILVDSYRKPEFKMTVTPLKSHYYVGDEVQIKVKCEYYFGGPVVGAKISAYGDNRPYYSWNRDEDDEDYGDDYTGGEGNYAGDLNGVTNNDGEVILTYKPEGEIKWTSDRQANFSVTGTESGDKYFEGSGSVVLYRGDASLDISPDLYVVGANSKAPVTATVVDPVSSKPMANQHIVLMYGYNKWNDSVATFVRQGTLEGTTDVNGKAHFEVPTTEAAEVQVQALLHDQGGREINAETSIWVWGTESHGEEDSTLELITDKKEYKPGETAHVLIRSDAVGASVLVCLEGQGLISHQTVNITQQAQKVDVVLPAEAFPNATISVSRISKKQFRGAEKPIRLRDESKRLKVSVKANQETFKPGQDATYTVETKAADGTPISAEVALGIVDESVYAIRKDSQDPYKTFYPKRYSQVETLYSFPELYLDGGDKTVSMPEIRRDFRDTAYWNPTVRTDGSGHATVTVHLPDNLTSWRATVTAVSSDTACGKAISNVQVRKDLMVRLSMPLYMVRGDEVRISALITNNMGSEKPVNLELRAPGLDVVGETKQTVNASPTKGTQVSWIAHPKTTGTFTVTGIVTTSGASDGMELPIQIVPRGVETVDSQAAMIDDVTKTFEVKRTADTGQLSIRVEPSISALLGGTVESLVDYPYGCVEQTMSRFAPALAVKSLLGTAIDPTLSEKIDKVAKKSMRRLETMQHGDGGFGWWEHDDSDLGMTGLVLEGLFRAKSLGYPVPEDMVHRARQWSEKQFPTIKPMPNKYAEWRWLSDDRLQFLLGYSRWGWSEAARPVLKDIESYSNATGKEHLTPGELGMLALIQQLSGASEHAHGTVIQMTRLAVENHSVATWPDADIWGSGGTARCLQALNELTPGDPLVEQTVNYLWQSRKADGWMSTRDTAQVIYGLIPWLQNRMTTQSVSTYTVLVNGKPVAQGTDSKVIKLKMSELNMGANKVEIQKSGDLKAFLGVSLLTKQIPEPKELDAENHGITVTAGLHELEAARLPDGTSRLLTSTSDQTTFKSGQPVRYKVNLDSKEDREFVMVRIPRPSNLFVVDATGADWWNYSWSGQQIFDDHVALFIRHLSKGTTTLEVNFRAEAPGQSVALPVSAYCMYLPEIRGRSSAMKLEVKE